MGELKTLLHYLEEDLEEVASAMEAEGLGGSRIMVTGGTGLIGSLLCRSVGWFNRTRSESIECVALVRDVMKIESLVGRQEGVTPVLWDAASPLPSIAVDYVVHAACPTASAFMATYPTSVMVAIAEGTRHVLDYCESVGVAGTVYLSSVEAFGVKSDDGSLSAEGDLGQIDLSSTRSCYPEAKRYAELLCRCYAVERGVPVAVARLAQVFGPGVLPGESRVFAQFARSVLAGEDIVLKTAGRSVGNYCYTADALRAIVILLARGERGETYTVANEGSTMTVAEMARVAAEVLSGGCSRVAFDIPRGATGYAADTGVRLSAAKMCSLGWAPRVGLVDSYRRMAPYL